VPIAGSSGAGHDKSMSINLARQERIFSGERNGTDLDLDEVFSRKTPCSPGCS
jgi:hypothetical protein